MNKPNHKLQFSFSNSSALILNSFNQVKNLSSASAVDNFLKMAALPEKTVNRALISESFKDARASISEPIKGKLRKITFRESEEALEKPIPSFNADNKQKLAQLKLNNKNVKGILKKNPKYLIPNDIITEQIKKYEREILSNEKEIDEKNGRLNEQDKKLLIESFYFPSETLEIQKNQTKDSDNKQEESPKKTADERANFFKYNLLDYDNNKNEKLKEENNEQVKKQPNFFKPPKNNVFTSMVNNILIDNPFAKLKNKSSGEKRIDSPLESMKIPYYQETEENENFVVPQALEKSKKKPTESDESGLGLFNYDKKQNIKRTKLQTDWTFIEEDTKNQSETKKSPNIFQNILKTENLRISTEKTDKENFKKVDEKEIASRLKEIESLSTPILKEWPERVNYNFGLNVSRDEKSLNKAKDDLNQLSTLVFKKKKKRDSEIETQNQINNESKNQIINMESKSQINKLRFFLSNYFIFEDTYRKNEMVFSMQNKIVIKHDLNKNMWSFYQLDEALLRNELFAICSYNNLMIISGGIDPVYGEITKNTYIFNYDAKSMIEKNPMKFSRYKHLLLVIGNIIYCIGGCSKGEIGIKNCEKYLIEEDKWINMAPLKIKRKFLRGVSSIFNNSIYVLGGNDEDNHLILVIEKYDVLKDVWGLINFTNEIIISNDCKLFLLNKKSYCDKVLDDILVLDKKNGENGLEFKSSMIYLENAIIEEDLEFKLNPENYIVLHQDSFYIFQLETFEKSDKLSLKTSFAENINFEFCL